jgi:hypothetical protein
VAKIADAGGGTSRVAKIADAGGRDVASSEDRRRGRRHPRLRDSLSMRHRVPQARVLSSHVCGFRCHGRTQYRSRQSYPQRLRNWQRPRPLTLQTDERIANARREPAWHRHARADDGTAQGARRRHTSRQDAVVAGTSHRMDQRDARGEAVGTEPGADRVAPPARAATRSGQGVNSEPEPSLRRRSSGRG